MSKTYRDARNAACAAQSAMDQIVHALTEAALDQAEGKKITHFASRLLPMRNKLNEKIQEMYEAILEQPL